MADYDITTSDVEDAATLLRDVLSTRNPDNDYSEGSVLGDTIVDGHATAFALLRKQLNEIRYRLSLRDIAKLGDSESVRDAADAILANFYRTRDQGRFAKGSVVLHFAQRVDTLVPRRTRFFKTPQLVYYVDGTSDIFIPSGEMVPNVDSSGRVVDFVARISLTAARVGSQYNQPAGRFVAVDPFSPFLTYAENTASFAFGDDMQTTEEFIITSSNAFSLRALVNARSNDSLLRGELFPEIQTLLTVNYGDPEMQRDLVTDPASGTRLHVGGHSDIYVKLETQEVVDRLEIGGLYTRPDNQCLILRDTTLPSGSFITSGIVPGDVLVLVSISGTSLAPFEYVIREVRATEVEISPRTPFPEATDELSPIPSVEYTIGNNYPDYNNKLTRGPLTSITTSRSFSEFNSVMLPPGPVYRVKRAEILGAPSQYDPYRDLITGNVQFIERLNAPVTSTPTPGSDLGYYVTCKNVNEAQSNQAVTMLQVGWPAANFSGLILEVTYTTVVSFDSIADYVADDFNRPVGGNPLVKGFHPVNLAFSIPYRVRIIPRNTLDVYNAEGTFTVSEPTVLAALVNYVNTTPYGTRPDTGGLSFVARAADANIVATYPFAIEYSLLAPNGKVYKYETDDIVSIFPDNGLTSSSRLTNAAEVGLPATGYESALRKALLQMGVSDRTVRYLTTVDDLGLEQRGV
jgi:hypothetical protein